MTESKINRILRRRFGTAGWTLLIYYGIMNVMVLLTAAVQGAGIALEALLRGVKPVMQQIAAVVSENAWGYLFAAAVGTVIVIGWKGTAYLGKELWRSRKPMRTGAFLAQLCVFCGCQLAFSLMTVLLDLLLRPLGVDITASIAAATVQQSSVSMLLYISLIAPLTEEILFRGLIRGLFRPYGKRFSIFASAFFFGVFHGNLVQIPFAFTVGLILGYVAEEYALGWSVLLHGFNNFVLGILLTELSEYLPANVGQLLQGMVLMVFSVGAVWVLLANRQKIRQYRQTDRMDRRCLSCLFTNGGMILFLLIFALNMVLMLSL